MSERKIKKLELRPQAQLIGCSVASVDLRSMGIGPIAAVPKVLEQVNLSLDAIDLIELNEAFAAQSLAVIRELDMDMEKVNVNGGANTLGHPLGCTGYHVDLHIWVNGNLTVAGYDIAHEVRDKIIENAPQAFDVHIHVEPQTNDPI